MLRLPIQVPVFIVLDALDECPDSSGIPSPRDEVLNFRPEVDIRAVLEPIAFHSVSLHDECGQKIDIANYVRHVVNLSPKAAMRRWREDDKKLVIETLTERADGMFRWVFCQLDALQHCFPPNLRQFLNELPETLDKTYERILKGINKAQRANAHRLLQCLTVAVRPLRVEELAELLAFDFHASSSGGIPTLKEDWRCDNQEEAVLSTCSSLIAIVPDPDNDSEVVQFSHFSVKEYLTSPPRTLAHTIMAQACLATLLQLDKDTDAKVFPLAKYAAQSWVDHAQFKGVSSRVQDGMDDLFDASKPRFASWLQVHDIDEQWDYYSDWRSHDVGSPLYYAAFCGFYDLTERLITKHPEQVNTTGGLNLFPLPAALHKRHFRVANLLHVHGAVVDVTNNHRWTPIHVASRFGHLDLLRWLVDHGANPNVRKDDRWTSLHLATCNRHLEAVQVLLEHNADVNSRNDRGNTPLYLAIPFFYSSRQEHAVDVVRQLLERGADPNTHNHSFSTPLHEASSRGSLEIVRLLLNYRAKGRTPFQVASEQGYDEIKKLLLEHGAVPQP
ncbi:ankyrin repeat-containing domain protein [Lactarius quietus]|nr:ankyrin repeat-containing domain protein [Lactarius quietus]